MSISIGDLSNYVDASKETAANSKLQNTLSKDLSTSSDDELLEVCKDFEAYFIEQVLKEVEKTVSTDEGNSYAAQVKNIFKDNMIQTVSEQIGEQSGNSFAQMMYEQMKRNYGL